MPCIPVKQCFEAVIIGDRSDIAGERWPKYSDLHHQLSSRPGKLKALISFRKARTGTNVVKLKTLSIYWRRVPADELGSRRRYADQFLIADKYLRICVPICVHLREPYANT